MNCPYCSEEMIKGGVKVDDRRGNILNSVTWYPEEELNKKVKDDWINLKLYGEGYLCERCMRVVSIFEIKFR